MYVCLIFDRRDKIVGVQSLATESDKEAVDMAATIACGYQDIRGYELWRRGERVATTLPASGLLAESMTKLNARRTAAQPISVKLFHSR